MITGQNVGVMYGTESTYGTAVAATTALGGKVTDFSPTLTNNMITTRGLGEGRNVSEWLLGNFDVAFSITFEVADMTFFQYLIGQLTGAGTSDSDPKILTEGTDFAAGNIDSFTMVVNKEDGSSDMEDTYTGCILNEVTLNGAEGATVTATVNGFAKSYSTDTAIANAYTPNTLTPYIGAQTTLKWGATPSTVAKVPSWSVTINNNAILYRSIGSRFIEQPVAGFRDYLFTLSVRESQAIQSTLMSNFLVDGSEPYTPTDAVTSANPTASLELNITMAEGAASGDRKAIIQLDEAALFDWSEGVRLENDIVQVTYNGGAKEGKSNIPMKWVD